MGNYVIIQVKFCYYCAAFFLLNRGCLFEKKILIHNTFIQYWINISVYHTTEREIDDREVGGEMQHNNSDVDLFREE